MNKSVFIIIIVIIISFFAGKFSAENTGLVTQASYRVSVGMPEEKMNWGRGWNPQPKTSARAITMCIPGEIKCLTEEGFATCQETGTSWSVLTPCPELHYCNQVLNQCVPRDCVHGTTYCRDSVYYLKCVNGRIDEDNVYECPDSCDPVTNKCVETEFPSKLITAFD
ncbi:hypothetical protein JW851_01215 [Candidatus Woesearchaeota archaeon]|nr:hypothetical protein [Candidatus Woesearchaeota archaeon]